MPYPPSVQEVIEALAEQHRVNMRTTFRMHVIAIALVSSAVVINVVGNILTRRSESARIDALSLRVQQLETAAAVYGTYAE